MLVRFLIALPIGAVLGGWLLRRVPASVLTAVAMLLSAVAFLHMATWDATSLDHEIETLSLVLGGLGFGLAIAPVNAALLAHTADAVHGVASALLIVARMVGMLLGISALTTIGLRAFYAASDKIPPAEELCNGSAHAACKAYKDAVRDAGITQLHAVFVGAAVCALIAAVLALVLLREPKSQQSRDNISGMADFDDLLAANRTFADNFGLSGFDGIAHAGVAMVTCMDSRIDPLADDRSEAGRRQDPPQPRRPRHGRGARRTGARRQPAGGPPDPCRRAHPLRDGVHRGRAQGAASASPPAPTRRG